MATATLSPIVALLLALSMLISPAAGTSSSADLPEFSITVEDVNADEDLSFGLAETVAGQPVAFYTQQGDGYYITGDSLVFTMDGKTYALPTSELVSYVYAATNRLPQPDEQDAMAVSLFVQSLITSVSADAVSFAPRGEGFTFSIDLDRLVADLDAAVPKVLATYAYYLNPTIAKYSQALFGQPITAAQLAQAWPELGLSELKTGLTIKMTAIPTADGFTLMGSVMEFNFVARVGSNGLEFRLTAPNGVVYPFDSQDLLSLVGLFAQLPATITPDAFSFNEVRTMNKDGRPTHTTTIKLDTTALARDLNAGMANILTRNSAMVDSLLKKYSCWLALLSPSAANITAADLARAFSGGAITLPALKGELVMVDDTALRLFQVNGYLNNVTLTGEIRYRHGDGTFLLTASDSKSSLYLNMDVYTSDYGPDTFTFTSNAFPGFFNTLSITSWEDRWNNCFAITTDTDVFRMTYTNDVIALKISDLEMRMSLDQNDSMLFDLILPDFFATMRMQNTGLSLDTTYFGLDVKENEDALVLSGYLTPDEYERYDFGLDAHPDASYTVGTYHGFLSGEGMDYSFSLIDNILHVNLDGDLYSFIPEYSTNAYVVYCNREAIATIQFQDEGDKLMLLIYEGHANLPPALFVEVHPSIPTLIPEGDAEWASIEQGDAGFVVESATADAAEPIYIVTVDLAPGVIPLPSGAKNIDMMTFLTMLEGPVTPVQDSTYFYIEDSDWGY